MKQKYFDIKKAVFKSALDFTYKSGGVVQLVRTSACHAEGREFESRRSRHFFINNLSFLGNSATNISHPKGLKKKFDILRFR